MISLQPYQKADDEVLRTYSLDAAQVQFTALPQEWLDKRIDANITKLVSIFNDDDIVGFFVLDRGDDCKIYSDNPQAILLRSMSILSAHQGKGYARSALAEQVLHPFVREHFPDCNEIVLGVNHSNQAAIHLYLRCGFHDTKREHQGIKGMQYIFSRAIAEIS